MKSEDPVDMVPDCKPAFTENLFLLISVLFNLHLVDWKYAANFQPSIQRIVLVMCIAYIKGNKCFYRVDYSL